MEFSNKINRLLFDKNLTSVGDVIASGEFIVRESIIITIVNKTQHIQVVASHISLAASFIFVVDDIFPDIVGILV